MNLSENINFMDVYNINFWGQTNSNTKPAVPVSFTNMELQFDVLVAESHPITLIQSLPITKGGGRHALLSFEPKIINLTFTQCVLRLKHSHYYF